MKHVGEIIIGLDGINSNKNSDEEQCRVCGALIQFSKKEFKKPCKDCGTWVFQRLKEKRVREKRINCFICMDKGILEYQIQKDGTLYNYVARCNCPKGIRWSGAIPLLDECMYAPKPESINKKNRVMYNKDMETHFS